MYICSSQSSPPAFCPAGRTNDIDALLSVINEARIFVYIAVMDYSPILWDYNPRHGKRYWLNTKIQKFTCITFDFTLHYITLHYIILNFITLYYITLVTLHYKKYRNIMLRYMTLYYITSHYLTLYYVTLHYIALQCIVHNSLRIAMFHITLRFLLFCFLVQILAGHRWCHSGFCLQ